MTIKSYDNKTQKTQMKKLFILIAAISLVACGSPKVEEVVAVPAVDSCAEVCVDTCAIPAPPAVEAPTAVVTPTVK